MTKYAPPGACDLRAIKSDGTAVEVDPGNGVTLTAGTWYFPWGNSDAPLPRETPYISVQLQWAAAVAGTFTFEACNYPKYIGGIRAQGRIDVDDIDANAARTNWVQYNPTSSIYVPTPTGAGNSATGLTITAGGTNFGGTVVDLGNFGPSRGRTKAVLTVGGLVRICLNAKGGA